MIYEITFRGLPAGHNAIFRGSPGTLAVESNFPAILHLQRWISFFRKEGSLLTSSASDLEKILKQHFLSVGELCFS